MTIIGLRPSKYREVSLWVAVCGTLLAMMIGAIGFGISAQTQTLFSDDFQDGNANGWTKSGGTWSVVTDGSLVYLQSGTSADTRARAGSTPRTSKPRRPLRSSLPT